MWRYLMCILTTSSNLLPRSSPNNFDKHASHLAVGVSQERNNKFNDMSVVFFYLLRLHTKGQKALQKLISFSPLTLQVLSEANLVCSEVRLPRHPGADTSNSYYCHWTLPLASQGLWFSTPDVIIHARALTRLLWNSILCFCNHRTPFSSWPNDIDIVRTQANVWCGHLCFSGWSATSTGQGWGRCGKEQGLKCQENNTNLNCLNYANQLC